MTNRKPVMCCGHTVCEDCYDLRMSENSCPIKNCPAKILDPSVINQPVLTLINFYRDQQLEINDIDLCTKEPVFYGMFADIYETHWHNQKVIVKAIRPMDGLTPDQLRDMKGEINLAVGFLHNNVVKFMGITTLNKGRFGIVMEKVDAGPLSSHLLSLETPLAVNIARGIVDGLKFLHLKKKVIHFNIKPQNILLHGPERIPKISDVIVSKASRSSMARSLLIELPQYMAPEMLHEGQQRSPAVDIYSLSVILFEMFAKQPAEKELGSTVWQIWFGLIHFTSVSAR